MSEDESQETTSDVAGDASAVEKKFSCKYCGEKFDTIQRLGNHVRKCPKAKEAKEAGALTNKGGE